MNRQLNQPKDFAKFRGMLDLARCKEATVQVWKRFKAQEGRSRRSGSRAAWFYSWIGISGSREESAQD
jgi:hypothetical protein